jgi:hypothetical protein
VIVEIGQQGGAGSTYGRVDIAIDPGRHHGRSLVIALVIVLGGLACRALLSNVTPMAPWSKGQAAKQPG